MKLQYFLVTSTNPFSYRLTSDTYTMDLPKQTDPSFLNKLIEHVDSFKLLNPSVAGIKQMIIKLDYVLVNLSDDELQIFHDSLDLGTYFNELEWQSFVTKLVATKAIMSKPKKSAPKPAQTDKTEPAPKAAPTPKTVTKPLAVPAAKSSAAVEHLAVSAAMPPAALMAAATTVDDFIEEFDDKDVSTSKVYITAPGTTSKDGDKGFLTPRDQPIKTVHPGAPIRGGPGFKSSKPAIIKPLPFPPSRGIPVTIKAPETETKGVNPIDFLEESSDEDSSHNTGRFFLPFDVAEPECITKPTPIPKKVDAAAVAAKRPARPAAVAAKAKITENVIELLSDDEDNESQIGLLKKATERRRVANIAVPANSIPGTLGQCKLLLDGVFTKSTIIRLWEMRADVNDLIDGKEHGESDDEYSDDSEDGSSSEEESSEEVASSSSSSSSSSDSKAKAKKRKSKSKDKESSPKKKKVTTQPPGKT